METKTCSTCGEAKPIDQFYLKRKGGTSRKSNCKDCNRKVMRDYMRKRPTSAHAARERHLKRTYGLSTEDYDALVEKQNGCCAICRTQPDKPLYVDHCHNTGKVRGLLCLQCNSLLGHAKDDSDRLFSAVMYLRETGTCRTSPVNAGVAEW